MQLTFIQIENQRFLEILTNGGEIIFYSVCEPLNEVLSSPAKAAGDLNQTSFVNCKFGFHFNLEQKFCEQSR